MARTARQFPQGKFTLRTPKQTKNGQMYAIYIYYYWQGRQLRRSADLLVHKNDWNQSANNGVGELRASYGLDFQQRNAYLQRMLRSIDSQIMQYVEKHGDITCEVIEGFLNGSSDALRPDQGIDFIQFAKQRFIDRYNSGKIGVSSRENGISYMNQLAKFLKQEQRGSHGVNNELLYCSPMLDEKYRERKCPLPIFDIIYFTTLSSILLSLHHDLFAVYDVQALCGLGNAATAQIVEVTIYGGCRLYSADTCHITLEDDIHSTNVGCRSRYYLQPATVGGKRSGILYPCKVMTIEHVVVCFSHVVGSEGLGL